MAMAQRLRSYLEASGVPYEVLPHPHSSNSAQTARRARVPLARVAKPVLLEDDHGFVLAIVSAARRIDLERLGRQLHRDLRLAKEEQIELLFSDCVDGAMPAIGSAYRIPTIYDDSLMGLTEIYFEAGNHDDVVHMTGDAFLELLSDSLHGRFTQSLSVEGDA